ncbi:MAG TPA: PIN domain-containing protein [Bryobacteraceae bacterium]|nr:PIN domain-containing protein [Bryobacteraceae bacterium]
MNFVDSGALLAVHLENDQYHRAAIEKWRELAKPAISGDLVIAEFATTLARRAGYRFAANAVEHILTSANFEVVRSSRDDEFEALCWMRKFADQRVSFTDCVSFAIMRRLKIRTAFTFDRHFRLAGFEVLGLK